MPSLIILDRRPPNSSTLHILPRNPTPQQVVDLFGLSIEKTRGEMAAPVGEWYWRVAGFSLNEGPVVYWASVRDPAGNPMPGIRVVRHWPGAPVVRDDPHLYSDRGVVGTTESGGDKFGAVEFQYTADSAYDKWGKGPDSFWVVSAINGKHFSDMAFNFGWWGGTVHLNPSPIFQAAQKTGGEPEPDPEEPPAGVDRAPALLAELATWYGKTVQSQIEAAEELDAIRKRYEKT